MLKIQSMSYHNSGILIWPKWCKHINSWHSKNLLNMSGLVQCEFICFCKHVKTSDANWYDCTNMSSNITTRFDMILQTCPNLFKYYDTIWYDFKNMSWLVQILWLYLIRFYNQVQTCSNITTRFDTILQTCQNLFKY